jgi:hypothetical protein
MWRERVLSCQAAACADQLFNLGGVAVGHGEEQCGKKAGTQCFHLKGVVQRASGIAQAQAYSQLSVHNTGRQTHAKYLKTWQAFLSVPEELLAMAQLGKCNK